MPNFSSSTSLQECHQKNIRFILLLLLLFFSGAVVRPTLSQSPSTALPSGRSGEKQQTLSFSSGDIAKISTLAPRGWNRNGKFQNYEIRIDEKVKFAGAKSVRIKNISGSAGESAGIEQGFNTGDYHGKRLRMSAWVKTDGVQSAALWMRVNGSQRLLGFDNMRNRAIKGTTDWKKYEITLDLPEYTVFVCFGFSVTGKGEAWADDFQFEPVGKDIPTTNMLTPAEMSKEDKSLVLSPAAPNIAMNLDFEQGTNSPKKIISVEAEILDSYVGEYQHPDGKKIRVIREADKLLLVYPSGEKFELMPLSKTDFLRENNPQDKLIFVTDKDGRVSHYISRVKMWHDLTVNKIK